MEARASVLRAGPLQSRLTAAMRAVAGAGFAARLLIELGERAGRLVWNGCPTGFGVGHLVRHGGPAPSTKATMITSIRTAAGDRVFRPVCCQNASHKEPPDPSPDDSPHRMGGRSVLPS